MALQAVALVPATPTMSSANSFNNYPVLLLGAQPSWNSNSSELYDNNE
ncbi:MAG: hypothetical protein LBQ02_04765 [Candidatus Nomurabacteria bacterium]|nr:hypothetical protein [Candidatus Nomurabacteria bacterium]